MPTCLITGATGFIGNHARRDLAAQGWNVHVLARDPGKITDGTPVHSDAGTLASFRAALDTAKPDVVIHLATCYLKDHQAEDVPSLISSNVTYGTMLLEAMCEAGCRSLVVAGTAWQHLDCSDESYRPATLYAATKQAFEDVARWYVEARKLTVIALHFGDTYGPADPRPKIFGLLEKAKKSREPLELSPGEQHLDPLYVGDATSALHIAALRLLGNKNNRFTVFRVTPGLPMTLRKVVEIWCKINDAHLDLRWGAKPYRDREVMRPWQGGTVLPNWTSSHTLVEGLKLCRGI
jgi:nucleoside-diphosphate-sugar epimerase